MADVATSRLRLNVVRMGSGEEVIVLVHGMVVDNLSSWYMSLAPVLAKTHSLVLYDLRGHGLSERTPAGYTMDDHVEDLAALLDACGLEGQKVTLAGNSSGGLIALMFAIKYPQRVQRLIMIDSHTGMPDLTEKLNASLYVEGGEGGEGDELNQEAKVLLEQWTQQMRMKAPTDKEAAGIVWAIEHNSKSKRRNPTLAKMELLINETSFREDLLRSSAVPDEALGGLQIPTLALYGADSDLREDGERLARLVPDCELHLLPGAAHFILMLETATVGEYVTRWLRRPLETRSR